MTENKSLVKSEQSLRLFSSRRTLIFLPMKVATNHDSTFMSLQSPPDYVDIVFIRLREAVFPFDFFPFILIPGL